MYPNWVAWQIGSLIGMFLGSAVPTEWQLGFAGTLAILCIMVPLIVNSAALCGVLVAAPRRCWRTGCRTSWACCGGAGRHGHGHGRSRKPWRRRKVRHG